MLLSRPGFILNKTCLLNSKRSMSTSSVPLKVYTNPDKDKELIINENKGLSGIYRWVHIDSGKSYIGSSVKLNTRFRQYFNYNHISYPKRNLIIYKSLLKYGYSGFRLEILEYCSYNVLIQREQFYFDVFNPEYNILKIAGSPLGYRHSEASKKLISLATSNREVSESTRDIKRNVLLGKKLDKERLAKMHLSNTLRQSVLLTNTDTGEIKEFSSMTDAGVYLGISRVTIRKYLLSNISYKGYTITKAPSLDKEIVESSSSSKSIQQQPILLTNKATGISKEFSSITEAAEYLDISRARLWHFFNKMGKTGDDTFKGYIVSKITDSQTKANRKVKKIEVTDVETKEVTIYPSFTLAAEALCVPPSSLSGYFAKKRTNLYKNRYNLKLV